MIGFHGRQVLVAVQIVLALLICGLVYWFSPSLAPGPVDSSFGGRMQFLAPWLLIPALAVLACTIVTMLCRFFQADAFDGTRRPASSFLEINLRVTQNTLEQAFLAIAAWAGLALTLPASRLTLIPALAILFGIGRLLFWIGYQIDPAWRAIGFALTALPTMVALFWLAWVSIAG